MLKQQAGTGTIVGANVKLQGTLKDTSDIVVHGQVDGEVVSDQTVIIEENASIKGPVTAQVVTLSGTIRGSVEAKQKLEILPTGKLHGALSTKDLIIHSGAVFNGKSAMGSDKIDKEKEREPKNHASVKGMGAKESEEMFAGLDAEIE